MISITKTRYITLDIILVLLCVLQSTADAHIFIYRSKTNQLIEEYNDLPAQFGPSLPTNGLRVYVVPGPEKNDYACNSSEILPIPKNLDYPKNAQFVALVQRGGFSKDCTFELKVRIAQAASYKAVIVYNNEGDELEQMSAQNASGIYIPSVFVGRTTGDNLKSFFSSELVLVINDELPFNINTQLILPFSILFGLCFLTMIFYMIYKCIREERRLRRYRLPKSMLKKLPIIKYTKNCDIHYDTCVICLDEFLEGDKLRILPCKHPYHSHCIDPWLTENRRICPVCKRKVFTKGEARANRNRQSSLDNVTDTDDDTTPLLQPGANANASARAATNASNASTATASTTRHGTFRRDDNATTASEAISSDDENLLLVQDSPSHSPRRINPFDRTPNLPPHLAEQLSGRTGRSIWSLPIFRVFRRQQSISVVAPPFLQEVLPEVVQPSMGILASAMPLAIGVSTIGAVAAASYSSNNILNPNLSGSFKDDDDDDDVHQSIYEPVAVVTRIPQRETHQRGANHNPNNEHDSVFIQTPTQNGLAVCALPNTQNVVPHRARGADGGFTNDQFMV